MLIAFSWDYGFLFAPHSLLWSTVQCFFLYDFISFFDFFMQITFNYGHSEITEPGEEEQEIEDIRLGKRQRSKPPPASSSVHDPAAKTSSPAFEENNVADSTLTESKSKRGGAISSSGSAQEGIGNRKRCFCGAKFCSGFLPFMSD